MGGRTQGLSQFVKQPFFAINYAQRFERQKRLYLIKPESVFRIANPANDSGRAETRPVNRNR